MHLLNAIIIFLGLTIHYAAAAAETSVLNIGLFSESNLDGWQEKSFKGNTSYQFLEDNGKTILRAESKAAASGLFYEKKIDLTKTPILNWQWKIDNTIKNVNEKTKQGDDYPARVYVIFSGGLFFWQTRAINYVWSNNQKSGSIWKNAFTDNARMIAVQAGDLQTGKWISEKRDIRQDYKNLFGEDIETVDAVAIMTDTDNNGSYAAASYGDIFFSAK
jgi:hypothetical protein